MPGSSARLDGTTIVWPWAAAGFLHPFSPSFLSRWMPFYAAGALVFFVLFTVSGMIVRQRARLRDVSVRRLALAGALGGVIGGALRYLFS